MARKLPTKDVVIIGLGWTGSILGYEMAKAGLDVVAIERGPWRDSATDFPTTYAQDELRYDFQHELFVEPRQNTLTFRNRVDQPALPIRDWASFLPGNGVGGADLDFRDIEAFGASTAYLMSSGDGEKSRIYKTTDQGKSWTLQYTDKRAGFFLDSLACDSPTHCFALSDPVDGKFLILATTDGQHWNEPPRDKMPAALATEGAFAASGTSITLCGSNNPNTLFRVARFTCASASTFGR